MCVGRYTYVLKSPPHTSRIWLAMVRTQISRMVWMVGGWWSFFCLFTSRMKRILRWLCRASTLERIYFNLAYISIPLVIDVASILTTLSCLFVCVSHCNTLAISWREKGFNSIWAISSIPFNVLFVFFRPINRCGFRHRWSPFLGSYLPSVNWQYYRAIMYISP